MLEMTPPTTDHAWPTMGGLTRQGCPLLCDSEIELPGMQVTRVKTKASTGQTTFLKKRVRLTKSIRK